MSPRGALPTPLECTQAKFAVYGRAVMRTRVRCQSCCCRSKRRHGRPLLAETRRQTTPAFLPGRPPGPTLDFRKLARNLRPMRMREHGNPANSRHRIESTLVQILLKELLLRILPSQLPGFLPSSLPCLQGTLEETKERTLLPSRWRHRPKELRHPALPCPQLAQVPPDHPLILPAPGLENPRRRDAGRLQVLGRADP